MTFIAQQESEVEKGWPKVGHHLGLLTDYAMRFIPTKRIANKYQCCNESCANYGGIFIDEPVSIASMGSYSYSWCGWELLKEKIEPKMGIKPPFDKTSYQLRRVYQDELNQINRHGCIDFVSPIQNWNKLSKELRLDAIEEFAERINKAWMVPDNIYSPNLKTASEVQYDNQLKAMFSKG